MSAATIADTTLATLLGAAFLIGWQTTRRQASEMR